MKIKKWFVGDTSNTAIQFFRSLFVGGIATLADMAVLIAVRELLHLPEDIAAIFGFVFGVAVNYIICSFWVFAKAKVKNRIVDFIGFVIIGIIGLLLTQLIIAPFAMEGMFGKGFLVDWGIFGGLMPTDKYYIIGKMLAVVIVYMWNFFARKFILYRHCEEKDATPAKAEATDDNNTQQTETAPAFSGCADTEKSSAQSQETSEEGRMKKIVIIGAGPAGLTAALELLKQPEEPYEILILEETRAIGGISQTVRYHGNRMDIGGHRFFSKDDEIMDFWKELMPLQGKDSFDDRELHRAKPLEEGGPDPETEDHVMLVRDRISRIYYKKHFFDYPVTMSASTIKNMGFFTTMAAGFSYLRAAIFKKKETSLENFYINRFGKKLYSMFFEGYTEKLWGRHPREISADWGSQRVKGLSIRAVLKDMFSKIGGTKKKKKKHVETSLIEQFWYPKYGPGQLWERAAEIACEKGAVLLKNHSVRQIVCEKGRIAAVVCDTPEGKKTITGDIFISSMPVKDLVCGMTGELPPREILDIAEGLPYRDFVTIGLLVDRLELENQTKIPTLGNIVPDCWIYVQETDVKLGRIQIFNNWSPYMVKDPEHTVWIGLEYFCTEGDEFWELSDEDCIELAIRELEHMGVIRSENVLDSHRERIKKAYPAYFDTYAYIDRLTEYLDSFDNLFCIGRNGQHRYNNMDHSMLTAIRAARAIKDGTNDRHDIWNVNTEKDYHETKEQ